MSIFNNDNISTNPSLFLHYTLINMELYASDVKTLSPNEGNYKIEYNSKCVKNVSSNNFNVVFYNPRDNGNIHNYCVKNVYFYHLYHNNVQNITDSNGLKDLIGEFIIECEDNVNSDTFYLCFLLQSVQGYGTDDKPLKNNGSMSKIYSNIIVDGNGNYNYGKDSKGAIKVSPSADGTIPSQEGVGSIIYYDSYDNSKGDTKNIYVMVNLNPITISNAGMIAFLSSLSPATVPPFKKYPTKGKADILTGSMSSTIAQTLGVTAIAENPQLAQLLGIAAPKSGDSSKKNSELIDNDIYIDCNPTGASEEEIATYNIPINSSLTGDLQNSSFMQLCSNFAMFGLLLIAAYVGIPSLFDTLTKNASGPEYTYVQLALVGYFCIIFIGLFAEGFTTGNMLQISAGIAVVVLAVLTYVITTYKLLGMKIEGGFDAKDFGMFIAGLIAFLITDAYLLILVSWIFLAVSLVIMVYVYDYKSQFVIDIGLWVGLAGILPLAGYFTYISG